jgi:cell division protein FtsA
MNETKYAVGIDIGTDAVKVVVGHVESNGKTPTIIGVGTYKNSGMRKGTIVDSDQTAKAIDCALDAAERMSGYHIDHATVSINGSHVVGLGSRGVIAIGASGQIIGPEEIMRAEEAATVVQLPANREILSVAPRSYKLDSQDGIRNPSGMAGVRLEVDAYMITALVPHLKNLERVLEMTELLPRDKVLAGLAAARSVLDNQLCENGVILIDIGSSTTNVAVYEEGDIIHVAVLPIGSNNITNDLAIGLKTDLDIAEKVKIEHAVAAPELRRGSSNKVSIKVGSGQKTRTLEFDAGIIDEVVEARLAEIFELVNHELKKIKRLAKLPGGAVLTGGGAKLRGIADYAREVLSMNARVGQIPEFGGMQDKVSGPEFATVIGLMLNDLLSAPSENQRQNGGLLSGIGAKFSGLFRKK